MTRNTFGLALAIVLCLSVPLAYGQARGGKGGEKGGTKKGEPGRAGGGNPAAGRPGGERPGGERSGGERPGGGNPGAANPGAGRTGAAKPPGGNWSAGKPTSDNNTHKAAGAEAVNNRNAPPASGAEGAAAGAAAANRNAPKNTGAEGAAAGAAAANRNAPKTTGAEGAAAGAAAANRNAPKATGAEGAAAGAAAANRNNPQVSGAAGATAGYAAVRNSFDRPDLYGQQWQGSHPDAWTAAGWGANSAWTPTAWAAVASHGGYGNSTPTSYNYGTNVTCVNGSVVLDGQTIGTAEDFSQQAADLAQAGTDAKTADSDKWLPLGVFAMVRNEQQHPQLIVQLAMNQNGVLRGNYTDEVTDHTLPIHGAVDQKTQRAAWTVGGNTSSVMEAGLSNLTQGDAPALLHKNGKTDRWILVRLEQPK